VILCDTKKRETEQNKNENKKVVEIQVYEYFFFKIGKNYFYTLTFNSESKTLSQYEQIIKNKIRFNYINIDEIKYKNIRFCL